MTPDRLNRDGAASFTIRGSRNGSLVTVTWVDGRLKGDFPTIALAEIYAEVARDAASDRLSPELKALHESIGSEPFANPDSTYRLLESIFDKIAAVTGDVPHAARGRDRPLARGKLP